MLLNEDMFEILGADVPNVTNANIDVVDIDTTVPEAGPEVGISTLIMNSITSTYSMIEDYNSLSIALTDIGNESAAVAIADIIRMEHSNIGALQDILKEISPNAEAVDINESLNESFYSNDVYPIIEDVCNICNVDISNVDISHYDENVIYLFNVSEGKAGRFFEELKNKGIRCRNFKSLDGYKAVFDSSNFNESLNESYESKFRDIVNYLKVVFPEDTHWSYDDYRAIPDDLGGGMRFQVEFDSNDSSLQSKIINALKEKYHGITCSKGWGSDWDYYISIKIDEEFC